MFNKTLETLGAVWVFVEALAFFLSDERAASLKGLWWVFLAVSLLVGVWRGRTKLTIARRVSGTDAVLTLRVCDAFDADGHMIVGANTTFDTTLDDGTIHPKSIQGQFTTKETTVEALDRDLAHELRTIPPLRQLDANAKPFGKRDQYPVGTVVRVRGRQRDGYFVAIATLNAHRAATSTTDDVLAALPVVWEHVRSRGEMEDLVMPVIGSGFARVSATRDALIAEIVRSFVAAARTGRFCERLTIAISPQDFAAGKVGLGALERLLDHECELVGVGSNDLIETMGGAAPKLPGGVAVGIDPPPVIGVEAAGQDPLPVDARAVLEAAASGDGTVLAVRTFQGLTIRAGEQVMNEIGEPRSEARWEAAVQALYENDFLAVRGVQGEVYSLTQKGWAFADRPV